MSFSSGNPALANGVFTTADWAGTRTHTMSISGTVAKTSLLLAILTFTAGWSWNQIGQNTLNPGILFGSLIVAFILGMVTIFKPSIAPFTSPIYAAGEGVFLGALSRVVEGRYPGLAPQAVGLTFGVLALMLFLYGTRIIRVTNRLVAGITAATGAVFLLYLASWILGMFHVQIPFIYSPSPIGIAFSLFVVAIAAFNLLLDFDMIEQGVHSGAPKSMEWYGGFALMVTLIWLYLEILRLLMKLQDRR